LGRDGRGVFDYSGEARALLDVMVHKGEASDVPSGQFRYYDGALYLLGLLLTSGRFHSWM
jgi:hypothetical protein